MISAVVLTKNEEKNLDRCLKSLSWCNEILVIDDNSSDKTRSIAKKNKVIIIENPLSGDFSAQRNFALTKAKNPWVLFVDADEVVSDALAFELQESIRDMRYVGFYIKRNDVMWGKELRYGDASVNIIRFARKDAGAWVGLVHERWEIKGRLGTLKNTLVHHPHQTLGEFLQKLNVYTSMRALELLYKKKTANFLTIIFYTKIKFIQNYFIKQGFRDGLEGFIHALIMSFHSFLVRAKLWQLNKKRNV